MTRPWALVSAWMLCVASCYVPGAAAATTELAPAEQQLPRAACLRQPRTVPPHARPLLAAAYVADYSGNAGSSSSAPKPAAPAAPTNGAVAMAGGAVAAAGNVNIKVVDTSPGAQAQA